MSMNLCFRDGRAFADFPYQTSTKLSYAVMSASTREEKLKLIKADIERYGKEVYYWYEEIESMLKDGWQIDII